MELLLIGGSHDGERINVGFSVSGFYQFPKRRTPQVDDVAKPEFNAGEIEQYRLELIGGQQNKPPFSPVSYPVLILREMSNLEALKRLIAGYSAANS